MDGLWEIFKEHFAAKEQDSAVIETSSVWLGFDTEKPNAMSNTYIKGRNYDLFVRDMEDNNTEFLAYEPHRFITISPAMIEGISFGQNEIDNPAHTWDRRNEGLSFESFKQVASRIPDVKEQLNAGHTLSEIRKDPELSTCARVYFEEKVQVVERDGYYAFTNNGRHRVLAAEAAGCDIPVEVIGYEGKQDISSKQIPESESIYLHMNDRAPLEQHSAVPFSATAENSPYVPEIPAVKTPELSDEQKEQWLDKVCSWQPKQQAAELHSGNEAVNTAYTNREVYDMINGRMREDDKLANGVSGLNREQIRELNDNYSAEVAAAVELDQSIGSDEMFQSNAEKFMNASDALRQCASHGQVNTTGQENEQLGAGGGAKTAPEKPEAEEVAPEKRETEEVAPEEKAVGENHNTGEENAPVEPGVWGTVPRSEPSESRDNGESEGQIQRNGMSM